MTTQPNTNPSVISFNTPSSTNTSPLIDTDLEAKVSVSPSQNQLSSTTLPMIMVSSPDKIIDIIAVSKLFNIPDLFSFLRNPNSIPLLTSMSNLQPMSTSTFQLTTTNPNNQSPILNHHIHRLQRTSIPSNIRIPRYYAHNLALLLSHSTEQPLIGRQFLNRMPTSSILQLSNLVARCGLDPNFCPVLDELAWFVRVLAWTADFTLPNTSTSGRDLTIHTLNELAVASNSPSFDVSKVVCFPTLKVTDSQQRASYVRAVLNMFGGIISPDSIYFVDPDLSASTVYTMPGTNVTTNVVSPPGDLEFILYSVLSPSQYVSSLFTLPSSWSGDYLVPDEQASLSGNFVPHIRTTPYVGIEHVLDYVNRNGIFDPYPNNIARFHVLIIAMRSYLTNAALENKGIDCFQPLANALDASTTVNCFLNFAAVDAIQTPMLYKFRAHFIPHEYWTLFGKNFELWSPFVGPSVSTSRGGAALFPPKLVRSAARYATSDTNYQLYSRPNVTNTIRIGNSNLPFYSRAIPYAYFSGTWSGAIDKYSLLQSAVGAHDQMLQRYENSINVDTGNNSASSVFLPF